MCKLVNAVYPTWRRPVCVERGQLSLRFTEPLEKNHKRYKPRLDELNGRVVGLQYCVEEGKFVLDGDYHPWDKQAFRYRATFADSPFPNDQTCNTLYLALNPVRRASGKTVFYSDRQEWVASPDRTFGDWERAMGRSVVHTVESWLIDWCPWQDWPRKIVSLIINYAGNEPGMKQQPEIAAPIFRIWRRHLGRNWSDGFLSYEI